MITVRKEYEFENIRDILEQSWSGAKDTLEEVIEQGRENEAMQIIEDAFFESTPTLTQLNDFIWFELPEIMNLYDKYDK
jgi:hypothetical protein|nr:MAG TPA: hypothetical protein [Inoviridae sp.]